jgi:hypothetical protein
MLAAVCLVNVTGRFVVEPDVADSPAGTGRELVVVATSQAGWPLPFVAVGGQRAFPLAALEEGVHWISWTALAADLAIGLVLAAAGAWLLTAWTKGRRRLFQFGLLDALLLMGAIGLALGYGYLPRAAHLEDQRVVAEIGLQKMSPYRSRRLHDFNRHVVWQPGPTEWARQTIGEKLLPDTGRVVAANLYGSDVRRLGKLDRLRVLRIYGTVTDRELNQLSKLTELKCLDLGEANLRKDRGGWIDSVEGTDEFPLAMPQLRRLYAPNNKIKGRDLAGCASLEEVDLSGVHLDCASAQAIGRQRGLAILDLHKTGATDELLVEFSGLADLEMLDLSATQVTDSGLFHLRALPALRSLWLADTAITDAGLAELARFPALESVRLTGSRASKQGIAKFAAARPDCAIVP